MSLELFVFYTTDIIVAIVFLIFFLSGSPEVHSQVFIEITYLYI